MNMILKSRLYYTLFVVALVMVCLSLIILCSVISPSSPGTVTIANGSVPLAALPADFMDRLENPGNYETAQDAPDAPVIDIEDERAAPVDFRASIPVG